jgi:hypothetical protein
LGVGVICSLGGKTCGACCWGPSVSREDVASRLRRHRDLFRASRLDGRLGLLLHELRARRGLDLLLAPLFLLPCVGAKLRSWFGEKVVCAFVAFLDGTETTVGCLLHPSRWDGWDRRNSAFALLSGVGCGSPDYLCAAAKRFQLEPPRERRRFEIAAREMDWFDYSRAASTFAASCVPKKGVPTCPSSSTRR